MELQVSDYPVSHDTQDKLLSQSIREEWGTREEKGVGQGNRQSRP